MSWEKNWHRATYREEYEEYNTCSRDYRRLAKLGVLVTEIGDVMSIRRIINFGHTTLTFLSIGLPSFAVE